MAQAKLGHMYMYGGWTGVARDYQEAVKWYVYLSPAKWHVYRSKKTCFAEIVEHLLHCIYIFSLQNMDTASIPSLIYPNKYNSQ